MDRTTITLPRKQKGTVLAISLIILLLMTLIAVTAMQSTTLEEKMAGNSRDRDLALQAAESALRDAEAVIEARTAPPAAGSYDSTTGVYGIGNSSVPDYSVYSNWTGSGTANATTTITGIAAPPRYFIVHIADDDSESKKSLKIDDYKTSGHDTKTSIFSITTRGVGISTTSQVLIRSRYGMRF